MQAYKIEINPSGSDIENVQLKSNSNNISALVLAVNQIAAMTNTTSKLLGGFNSKSTISFGSEDYWISVITNKDAYKKHFSILSDEDEEYFKWAKKAVNMLGNNTSLTDNITNNYSDMRVASFRCLKYLTHIGMYYFQGQDVRFTKDTSQAQRRQLFIDVIKILTNQTAINEGFSSSSSITKTSRGTRNRKYLISFMEGTKNNVIKAINNSDNYESVNNRIDELRRSLKPGITDSERLKILNKYKFNKVYQYKFASRFSKIQSSTTTKGLESYIKSLIGTLEKGSTKTIFKSLSLGSIGLALTTLNPTALIATIVIEVFFELLEEEFLDKKYDVKLVEGLNSLLDYIHAYEKGTEDNIKNTSEVLSISHLNNLSFLQEILNLVNSRDSIRREYQSIHKKTPYEVNRSASNIRTSDEQYIVNKNNKESIPYEQEIVTNCQRIIYERINMMIELKESAVKYRRLFEIFKQKIAVLNKLKDKDEGDLLTQLDTIFITKEALPDELVEIVKPFAFAFIYCEHLLHPKPKFECSIPENPPKNAKKYISLYRDPNKFFLADSSPKEAYISRQLAIIFGAVFHKDMVENKIQKQHDTYFLGLNKVGKLDTLIDIKSKEGMGRNPTLHLQEFSLIMQYLPSKTLGISHKWGYMLAGIPIGARSMTLKKCDTLVNYYFGFNISKQKWIKLSSPIGHFCSAGIPLSNAQKIVIYSLASYALPEVEIEITKKEYKHTIWYYYLKKYLTPQIQVEPVLNVFVDHSYAYKSSSSYSSNFNPLIVAYPEIITKLPFKKYGWSMRHKNKFIFSIDLEKDEIHVRIQIFQNGIDKYFEVQHPKSDGL